MAIVHAQTYTKLMPFRKVAACGREARMSRTRCRFTIDDRAVTCPRCIAVGVITTGTGNGYIRALKREGVPA